MALFLLKFIILVTLQILLFYYTITCELNLVNDILLIFIISILLIVIIIVVTKYLIFINEHNQI